jgi:hypothetical protein
MSMHVVTWLDGSRGKMVSLKLNENGFALIRWGKSLMEKNWSQVSEVEVSGETDVNRRITATRLLGFGIFALAAKKKKVNNETFIFLTLDDGSQVVLQSIALNESQAKAAVARFRR